MTTMKDKGLILRSNMKFVPKPWGNELWIINTHLYCGKKIEVYEHAFTSYHYHLDKDEVLFVASGLVILAFGPISTAERLQQMSIENVLDDVEDVVLHPGQAFHVSPKQPHQIIAERAAIIYEFSTQHFDSDSYRLSTNRVV